MAPNAMTLALPLGWQYCVAVSEELADAVRSALHSVPCSDRRLSQESGVPPSTLSRIRKGERGATPAVTRALADALARLGTFCGEAERTLRDALEEDEK